MFTIEPGIYISTRMLDALPDTPKNRAFIAKVKPIVAKYENTGVRIEDDYLITETGLERISTAPREIAEIEALMKKRAKAVVRRGIHVAAINTSRREIGGAGLVLGRVPRIAAPGVIRSARRWGAGVEGRVGTNHDLDESIQFWISHIEILVRFGVEPFGIAHRRIGYGQFAIRRKEAISDLHALDDATDRREPKRVEVRVVAKIDKDVRRAIRRLELRVGECAGARVLAHRIGAGSCGSPQIGDRGISRDTELSDESIEHAEET